MNWLERRNAAEAKERMTIALQRELAMKFSGNTSKPWDCGSIELWVPLEYVWLLQRAVSARLATTSHNFSKHSEFLQYIEARIDDEEIAVP